MTPVFVHNYVIYSSLFILLLIVVYERVYEKKRDVLKIGASLYKTTIRLSKTSGLYTNTLLN